MSIFYRAINLFFSVVGALLLFASSVFSLVSKEDYDEQIKPRLLEYFLTRLAVDIIVILGMLLVIGLVDYLIIRNSKDMPKGQLKHTVLRQFIFFFLWSVIVLGISLVTEV